MAPSSNARILAFQAEGDGSEPSGVAISKRQRVMPVRCGGLPGLPRHAVAGG